MEEDIINHLNLDKEELIKELTLEVPIESQEEIIAKETFYMLSRKGRYCINILGSPGSGKTSFIEGISRFIRPEELLVIEGDLESDLDKVRLEKIGIQAIQINTHNECHLTPMMVKEALSKADLKKTKFIFIENIGNLVCPAGINLGQHANIIISSTTEGEDKPKKYPIIFLDAMMVVISKYDLKERVNFIEESYEHEIKKLNGNMIITKTSINNPRSFLRAAEVIVYKRKRIIENYCL